MKVNPGVEIQMGVLSPEWEADGDKPVFGAYVRRYWTPLLGATTICLAQLIVDRAGQSWSAGDVSEAIGHQGSTRMLRGAIGRLKANRLLAVTGDLGGLDPIGLSVRRKWPLLTLNQQGRLPVQLANECHGEWVRHVSSIAGT